MPKAKPVSLHPLTFDEAIKALIDANPAKTIRKTSKKQKRKRLKTSAAQ